MKEKFIMKKKPIKNKTNWKKAKLMSENDILVAAKYDVDAQPLSKNELSHFKRVYSPKKVNVKKIRNKLHLSQEQFGRYFGVSARTIQEWEQHRRNPTTTARNFLKVIEIAPEAIQKALSSL